MIAVMLHGKGSSNEIDGDYRKNGDDGSDDDDDDGSDDDGSDDDGSNDGSDNDGSDDDGSNKKQLFHLQFIVSELQNFPFKAALSRK